MPQSGAGRLVVARQFSRDYYVGRSKGAKMITAYVSPDMAATLGAIGMILVMVAAVLWALWRL